MIVVALQGIDDCDGNGNGNGDVDGDDDDDGDGEVNTAIQKLHLHFIA